MQRPVPVAIAAVAVFVLSAAGYWIHGISQKHAEQRKVTGLVRDTTGQLRQALAPRAPASLIARIDDNLQAAQAPRNPELAEAAELYIVSAREIARRRAEAERLERQAAADRAALEAHMARGARRNEAWFHGALELKKRVERDHLDLDTTLKALDELLSTLPEAEKKLAPHVSSAVLLDEGERQKARQATQLEAKRATAALERVRALAVR
jgi:hypothetical protein